ncbi:MAG TPA: O-antigen ligase family protein [Opitutaceae bacterium]
MMTAARSPAIPSPWHWGIAFALCASLMLVFEAISSSLILQAVMVVAVAGVLVMVLAPQLRITIVVLWVLVHPLSIEKVFQIAAPIHPDFMPTFFVFSASDIFFFILLAHLCWEAVNKRFRTFFWPPAATPFALLCIWVTVLFVFHDVHGMATLQLVHWWKMLAFLIMLPMAVRTRQEFMLVLTAIAVAILAQVCVVIASRALGRPISFITLFSPSAPQAMGFSGGSTVYTRTSGTFGHVNQQAGLHVFFTLPLIGLLYARNALWKVFGLAAVAGSMFAVLITFSRSAWVAGAFASVAMVSVALLKGKMRREYWYTLGAVASLAILLIGIFWRPISDRIFGGDEGASASRVRMLVTSLELIQEHPMVGVGPGNFTEASLKDHPLGRKANRWLGPNEKPQYEAIDGMEAATSVVGDRLYLIPLQVHNKYMLVTVELGLLGLVLFVWYQTRIFRAAWECLSTDSPVLLFSGIGLFGAFFATQVYYMFELVYDDKSMLILLFDNALMLALSRIVRQEREADEEGIVG